MEKNKILLVDDEEDIRDILSIVLTDMGYQILSAKDGEDALQCFEREHPSIVLTDIKMPGKDGFAVLRQIKSMAPDTNVIVITGHGDQDLARQAFDLDACAFFNKPLDTDALEQEIQRIEAALENAT